MLSKERRRECQQNGRTGRAVVGADEAFLEQRVIVPGQDENLLRRSGGHVELPDDVVDADDDRLGDLDRWREALALP